ncbi:MAG: radical SAM protein, partial [Candidatus Omnitrophota bacterium]
NTDSTLSSRVLEAQVEEADEYLKPGTYEHFKILIQLYPDKSVLEDILAKIRAQKQQEEEEARRKQEEELKRKQQEEEETRRKQQEEEESKRRKEEELKRKQQLEEENKRKAEEARRRQEEELKRKQLEEEEARRRQEEEFKRKQLEEEEARRRQEEELKRKKLEEEEARNRIVGYFKKVSTDFQLSKKNCFCLYGDSQGLNDKIGGLSGDFTKNIKKIKNSRGKGIVYIGVSRYNFFCLHVIAQYAATLIGQRIDLRSLGVAFLPACNLYTNFSIYLNELNQRLSRHKIYFFLKDAGLPELLYTVSSQSNQYNEKDLLRLLGVIAEHPFIGPQTIVLDTYHRCNTDCVHCWIHTPKRKGSGRMDNLKMDINLYKEIIDDAERILCDEVIIQGDGEPMLDNRFIEMITYVRNKGLKALFFTNGILLDKEKAAKIINLEVNEIFCSLPAGTAKTYALINSRQSRETFSRIGKNLKNLIDARNKAGKNIPLLQMTHVIHNLNYQEMEEMARFDASIGADKVRFYLVRLDKNIRSLKLKSGHIKVMQESLKRVEPFLKSRGIELQDNIHFQLKHYNPENGDWSGNAFSNIGCPVGWFFSLVLSRGELSMCCHLRIIDILKGKGFAQVWNSSRYDEVRVYAKHLMKHKDRHLLNGSKLFDAFCGHCDTHQVILRINQLMSKYRLDKFYKESLL